jgi:hypothetical protein
MLETAGAPVPPPSGPQKTNPWVIVIVVIVILCCFCVGAIGLLFAFGGPILNELGLLHAWLPTVIS